MFTYIIIIVQNAPDALALRAHYRDSRGHAWTIKRRHCTKYSIKSKIISA